MAKPDENSPAPAAGVSAEAITWAFRLLIGRDPVSDAETESHRWMPDLDTVRRAFSNTWEFFAFYDAVVDGRPTYGMPLYLMRPPTDPALPWRFAPPSLEEPVSQLCTAAQFAEPTFAEITEAMVVPPTQTRRSWEQAWIVSVLATAGLIGPSFRAIGFGVKRSRIAALLASRGVRVLATDAPEPPEATPLPPDARRVGLFYPEIMQLEDFDNLVEFREIEPGTVPADLDGGFDVCWSSSLVNHLGSLAAATEFIEASLRPLRPGGIAAHTMEINIRSDVATVDAPHLALPRRRDIEAIAHRLRLAGHEVLPINLHPGFDPLDEEVGTGPAGPPRLKQRLGALVVTSFGLAVRKGG